MKIAEFIKANKELKELPFLIVFKTMQILHEKGVLRGFDDVGRISK